MTPIESASWCPYPCDVLPPRVVRIYGFVQSSVGRVVSRFADVYVGRPVNEDEVIDALLAKALTSDAATALNGLLDALALIPEGADKKMLNRVLDMLDSPELIEN